LFFTLFGVFCFLVLRQIYNAGVKCVLSVFGGNMITQLINTLFRKRHPNVPGVFSSGPLKLLFRTLPPGTRRGISAGRPGRNIAGENATAGSANCAGSTFMVCRHQSTKGKNHCGRYLPPGNNYAPFFQAGVPVCVDALSKYLQHIPLLLRDMEFQLFAAEILLDIPDEDDPYTAENPLESYAITVHGIKVASSGILAMETSRKAEELENAALRGEVDFLKKKNAAFFDYMEYFLDGLRDFLRKEQIRQDGRHGRYLN
jgi:hypothetical protein